MRIKVEYTTQEERENLFLQYKDLMLVEEANITGLNYLVFEAQPEIEKKVKTIEEITAEHEVALVEAFELIAQLMEGGNE